MFIEYVVCDTALCMSCPRHDHGGNVTMVGSAGSVCCVAWRDHHQFATASADHVIQLHSGDQVCTATLRGDATDLTHLTWSPYGEHQLGCNMPTLSPRSCIASVTSTVWVLAAVLCIWSCSSGIEQCCAWMLVAPCSSRRTPVSTDTKNTS